jgi:hypothetical protein
LSVEWGHEHLDLSGTIDFAYVEWKNALIEASGRWLSAVSTQKLTLKELWEAVTTSKQQRLGFKYPKELYATRYRLLGSPDPRTTDRQFV